MTLNPSAKQVECSAERLGVAVVTLLDYRDGMPQEIATHRSANEREHSVDPVDLLVVFATAGVTGHPDHRVAGVAARDVAECNRLAVLEWSFSREIAFHVEFDARLTILEEDPNVAALRVNRTRQTQAVEVHRSENDSSITIALRFAFQGNTELARWRPPLHENKRDTQ